MTPPAGQPAGSTPASDALARSVKRVRARARAVLLTTAVVAAFAADIWYEIAGNALALLLHKSIYFPLFFLVAFAVFAASVFGKTRLAPFSRRLDARFRLKERLGAAAAFRASRSIPPPVVEAQARESAAAVDFELLRRSFRFRPYGSLLALALGAAAMGWLVWRYPERFQPRNLAFRQGTALVSLTERLGQGGAGSRGGRANREADQGKAPDRPSPQGSKKTPDSPGPGKDPEQSEKPKPVEKATGEQTARKKSEPPPAKPPRGSRENAPKKDSGSTAEQGSGAASPPSGETTWTREQSRAYEETRRVSPVGAKPHGAAGSPSPSLDFQGRGAPLPPLPLLRLLAGKQPADALLDPETVTIILGSYPLKYRSHLGAFLKALQARREQERGS